MLSYYAYTNAIHINYKIHNKADYSEKEYKDDKILGGISVGIVLAISAFIVVLYSS